MSNLSEYDPKNQLINELKSENNILKETINKYLEEREDFDDTKKSKFKYNI